MTRHSDLQSFRTFSPASDRVATEFLVEFQKLPNVKDLGKSLKLTTLQNQSCAWALHSKFESQQYAWQAKAG
jgi:hypothetical protein